ncbi:sulfotransferase family 2 domain-containing protein [Bacillus nitratireducens]|uniref:sulfotransferase family 2 domain-containing protein n=1 Tax=Bacillus nitratireducens TaxID=2026193 RepID=UPI000BEC7AD2|nr:sulfotransferase family 2 domain-containing protein [Bacillus nitratireducens]PEE14952.1 glyoxalase [Bacillus cereus]MED0906758.1 sulfotransferase family 2 domain-containing protein [Bacillus nitratireducens]PFH80349.1 glyoxalase [Bacillus cereus]PFM45711.1 glyoxalase [Bacillus cereus]PFR99915.1 glyoxalase [Bacillus cereus]
MQNFNALSIITAQARLPHFQEDFPLILFWSQKSGCTSLALWFFHQINLLETALKGRSGEYIHNYEYAVYKAHPAYREQVIRALKDKDKNAYKLVRNPYKRVVSAFLFFIPFFEIQHPHWGPIKKYLYNNENSPKGFSFKQFLYYLQDSKKRDIAVNPHYAQQYIPGEEEFVTNYIYLEKFNMTMRALEMKYNLTHTPVHILTKSNHHQSDKLLYEGDYADVDITDPTFPRFPTYQSFYDKETLELVYSIFYQDFKTYKYLSNLGND